MRKVHMVVGSGTIDEYPTWAYPNGEKLGMFTMPTYPLTVSGTDDTGVRVHERFEAFRFGIQCKDGINAHVVGLSHHQTHVIKAWIPTYHPHSAPSKEPGAWRVKDAFLIHDGPNNKSEVYASIGCVELVGLFAFDRFNDFLIELSGASGITRAAKLADMGKAHNLSITYQSAHRPPLKRLPPPL